MHAWNRSALSSTDQSAINSYRLNVSGWSLFSSETLVSLFWQHAEEGDLTSFVDGVPMSAGAEKLMETFFDAVFDQSMESVRDALHTVTESAWHDLLQEYVETTELCPFSGSVRFFNEWLDSSPDSQQEMAGWVREWFALELSQALQDDLLPAMRRAQEQVMKVMR